MEKRGVSPVIATVLLVILTLAAVGLVANYLVNFTKTGLGKAGECIPYREYFKFDDSFGFDCGNANGLYAVSIKAATVEDESIVNNIKGFSVAFTDENGESSVANVYNGSVSECGPGKTKMLNKVCGDVLIIPSMGGTKTYVYNSGGKRFKTAEVYAVLSNDRLCEKSDTIEIMDCTNQVN
jgi:flagellin-like protein